MQYKSALCALLSLLSVSVVHATDSAYPDFVFNGYGTLGGVHSSEDKADFRNSLVQPDGAGYTHDWAFGVDSRVGLQLTTVFSEKLSGVLQVVSEQQYDNSYTPTIEWANIKYAFTPDFSLRVGRIVLPVFMDSDYRKVGYANTRVRPPIEVYGLLPVSNNEGVDASYRFRTGSLDNTIEVYFGRKDFDTEVSGSSRKVFGMFDTTEIGALILHAGYHQANITGDEVNSFFRLFRTFGAEGIRIANDYDFDDKKIRLWTAGASYDPGIWFVKAEFAKSTSQTFIGTLRGSYLTAGYRIGNFTHYAGIAQRTKSGNTVEPGLNIAALPPQLRGFAFGLNAGLDTFLNANGYDTATIGIRWDFAENFTFKMQLDLLQLDKESSGDLENIQPGFIPGGNVDVFSAAIDFVF